MTRRQFAFSAMLGAPAAVAIWASRSWLGGPDMNARPFTPLAAPRNVARSDLPADLVRFYEKNEGVGLECSPDRLVRLCRLAEVEKRQWRDVPIFGSETLPGWEDFEAFSIGVSSFHDGIYWIQRAPCCPAGSILTLGPDVAGPGGVGPETLEPSLVLASSFEGWLARLRRHDWLEYGLAPGEIWDQPTADQAESLAYYKSLNPGITWEPMPEFM